MAERVVKVLLVGDSTSLQAAVGKAEGELGSLQATTGGVTGDLQQHGAALQTLSTFYDQNGMALSNAEQRYAEAQLASKDLATAEKDIWKEGRTVSVMMGEAGARGAELTDRMASLGGVMGSSGALGIGVGAALVGAGALVEVGKSMIDLSDKNEASQKGLAQAFDSQGKSLRDYQPELDAWLSRNSRFISDQYDAKDAIAQVIRTGDDWTQGQRVMNDALDLSAVKNISLSDATNILIRARSGDARALKDLGISMKNVEDPQKALAAAQKEVSTATGQQTSAERKLAEWEAAHHDRSKLTQADLMHEQDLKDKVTKATSDLKGANSDLAGAQAAVKDKGDKYQAMLDLLEPKIADAHSKTSDLKQSENDLGNTWDNLANQNGPGLLSILSQLLDGTNNFLKALGDPNTWKGINDFLVGLAKQLNDIGDGINNALGKTTNVPGGAQGAKSRGAVGVPGIPTVPDVAPGVPSDRGKNPATYTAPPPSATTTPAAFPTSASGRSGGTVVHVYVQGSVTSERNLALAIREQIRRLDRGQR